MAEIVLTTFNARYIHAAFGLRCLLANLGPLRDATRLLEFDCRQRPLAAAERILALEPRIVGLGVYVWNVTPVTETVALLKRIRPDLVVVLGGPEVSYETDQQPVVAMADYVITGEADLEFPALCKRLLHGEKPAHRILAAAQPDLARLALPYPFYTDEDIAHRVLYVEASRGCPFGCEFCLSSLDPAVRHFPTGPFLAAMRELLARGARRFKFVDRTFNLHPATARAILEFFLEHLVPGLFLHFEMVPDRLPREVRELVVRFPPGTLQFEVGVQTFDPAVATRIGRRQDVARLEENIRFLREQTGVHVHADLIVGLPGEDAAGFGRGFDRLVRLGPQEIQVGILKRLRGTPIVRHDAEWGMVWSPLPPFDLLCNRLIDFATMQRLRRFARFWDLLGNSGNFIRTLPLLWSAAGASPYACFLALSDWLYEKLGRTDSIALDTLARLLFDYLTGQTGIAPVHAGAALAKDYWETGRRELPEFLRGFAPADAAGGRSQMAGGLPKRQARFVARKP